MKLLLGGSWPDFCRVVGRVWVEAWIPRPHRGYPVPVVHGWVANTDFDWYQFLAGQGPIDEVNFWQPSGGHQSFHAIQPGEPFFFRLKSPRNAIAGFGFFARHVQAVCCSFAGDAFGVKNGAPDIEAMRRRIEHYRAPGSVRLGGDHEVGCLMISAPVFFPPEQWIAQPADWQQNIVQGKTYDLTVGEGRRGDRSSESGR